MLSRLSVVLLFFVVASLWQPARSSARIQPEEYGLAMLPDKSILEKKLQQGIDSLYQQNLFLKVKETPYGTSKIRPWQNKTSDFYTLLGLVLFLGVIRLIDPRYFTGLWDAYLNTGSGSKTQRDKLEQSTLPNILMNVFFVFAFGSYVFYLFRSLSPGGQTAPAYAMLLPVWAGGVALVYITKYLIIRFSGWAFDIEGVTDTYLFNVFLINKLLAIALIPFTVILAFQNTAWASVATVLSFILILALFISRYVKSWKVLGSFFHYSKFHFFTYLCASEIMPLAVLTKFLLAYPLGS